MCKHANIHQDTAFDPAPQTSHVNVPNVLHDHIPDTTHTFPSQVVGSSHKSAVCYCCVHVHATSTGRKQVEVGGAWCLMCPPPSQWSPRRKECQEVPLPAIVNEPVSH
eukprot:Phypoly_transcript_26365.p1 GENE.Phypoly_transcript_26365~~Phypoly_transcript_26365.p1  ORF type:complete len:108 (-),score=7.19 Phypoly_transcript_26365:91-414(-)